MGSGSGTHAYSRESVRGFFHVLRTPVRGPQGPWRERSVHDFFEALADPMIPIAGEDPAVGRLLRGGEFSGDPASGPSASESLGDAFGTFTWD